MFQNNLLMAAASKKSEPVEITYTDDDTIVGSATAFTFSSVALGTAAADRKIVVGIWAHGYGYRVLNTLTVGGVSALPLVIADAGDGSGDQTELWIAAVPSGTTGDIVATWASTKSANSIMVWGMTGASSAPNETGSSLASPLTDTVTIPANGGVIARAASGSSATFTWTNADEDAEYVANTIGQSGAHKVYAAEQTDLAITATQSTGASPTFAVASFGQSAGFMEATGGTETIDGNFKVHTFNASGTFTVYTVGSLATVDYLVIAGGGGGGGGNTASAYAGGGGGAGGYRTDTDFDVTAQAYTITIGAGGAGNTSDSSPGVKGTNSVFSTITSEGGGFGAAGGSCTSCVGGDGGSGGGGSRGVTPGSGTAGQGNDGGDGAGSNYNCGAGGGGAGAVGGDAVATATGGAGGAGTASSISGSSVTRAGGGGGQGANNGAGGSGGGGAGTDGPEGGSAQAVVGTANTGGGGGGGSTPSYRGAAGGSGVVIIRYKFQ